MLIHDQIIHAIEREYGLKHGRDFFVGHPVDGLGVQTGEPFIVDWRCAEIEQPDIDAVAALFTDKYASGFAASKARERRDFMLKQTDWTQLADIPDTTRTKFSEYRKALRDLPQQHGFPMNIHWPDMPE